MGDGALTAPPTPSLVAIEEAFFQRATGHPGREKQFVLSVPRFVLRRGDRIALAGPSGSGKTTLLGLLGFTLRPTSATVFVVNTDPDVRVDVAAAWAQHNTRVLDSLRASFVGAARHGGEGPSFLSARAAVRVRMHLAHCRQGRQHAEQVLREIGLGDLMRRTPEAAAWRARFRVP